LETHSACLPGPVRHHYLPVTKEQHMKSYGYKKPAKKKKPANKPKPMKSKRRGY